MICALCGQEMAYVHGHEACVHSGCPMFGVNQAECCDGETAANCAVPTSQIRRVDCTSEGSSLAPSKPRVD